MRKFVLIAVLALMIPTAVNADPLTKTGWRGWGPRVGVTLDPDQIHFGAHVDFGNFAEHIRFQPNVEVGIGDNLTIVALNFEGAYRFSSRWDVWTPYAGGGLGINFVSFDNDHDHAEGAFAAGPMHDVEGDDSSTDIGLNLLGGIEKGLKNGHRFFLEGKLGLADSPDLKFTAGWTFFH
jgi:opacity protein-like surface antigen